MHLDLRYREVLHCSEELRDVPPQVLRVPELDNDVLLMQWEKLVAKLPASLRKSKGLSSKQASAEYAIRRATGNP